MGRIVLASNRVVDLSKAAQAGGVAIAIADLLRTRPGLWLGWSGKIVDKAEEAHAAPNVVEDGTTTVVTIPLSSREYKDYYIGYANGVLWPVFHSRLDLAQFEAGYYNSYLEVNRRFARALQPLLRPDDTIWVHDYHMIPLGLELRKLGVQNPIGFFLHIPVPGAQNFLAIPEHKELARGLAAYDLVGLQTRVDVTNLDHFFLDGGLGQVMQDGRIRAFDRQLLTASFPVGIDMDSFLASRPKKSREPPLLTTRLIGVDRLDYTKGLPQKFRAFGRFLEKYPDYRRHVNLSQFAPPTRESVVAYADIRKELETLSGTINGKFGELDWVPIQYIHRSTPRRMLVDIFRNSRIGFVTPLRDGMNLVAKEYVAAQDPNDPGVLILSRFAGAAEQLTEALIVNPYNVEEMADSIKIALEMGLQERKDRNEALVAAIRTQDTFDWCRTFLNTLESAHDRETRPASSPARDAPPKAQETPQFVPAPPRLGQG